MNAAPATFHRRVELALKDPVLHAAMARATSRLVAARDAGMAAFEHAEIVRDHARAIRAHTIARLDEYLRQFENAVLARGGHVHWASTAEDAVAIVADIARQHGVRTAVKSKSMVSEEIDLNHALEAAGVEVLETDLGEFVDPDRSRSPLAHRRADHPQEPRRRGPLVPREAGRHRGRSGGRAAHDRLRPPHAARGVPQRRHGHLRRQLRRGRDRQPLHLHE